MARYDAREERWDSMEIKGVHGYFCDLRIDRATVPGSFDLWEFADDDSDGIPCRYRSGILVNFLGTFITIGRLPVDDMEYGEGYISSRDEWGFLGGSCSFSEIEEMEGCTKVLDVRGTSVQHGPKRSVDPVDFGFARTGLERR